MWLEIRTSIYEDVSTVPDNPNFVCGTCLPEEKEAARLRMPVGIALATAGRGQRPQASASSSSSGQTITPVTVESSEGDGEDTSDDESAPIAALNQAASAATVED